MLDGESFQKVDARGKNKSSYKEVKIMIEAWILTETFLALLALIDHAKEQVALPSKYCVDTHFELNIAIENVQRCLAKYDAMLRTVFL